MFIEIILVLSYFVFVLPRDVHAYLDPGSGSMFIQLLIATFLGGLYFIKLYWSKITAYIRSFFKKDKDEEKKPSKTKRK